MLNGVFALVTGGNTTVSFAPVNCIIKELIEVAAEIAFTYLVVYMLVPLYFVQHKKVLAFTGFIVSFFILFYAYYFIQDKSSGKLFYNLWFITGNFIGIGPMFILFLFLSVKMMKNYYLKTEEREQKQREKTNAEIQLLKAQVHPHFLFNTLNNIYSFTLSKSPQAPMLVDKLNNTLYYMINECKAQFVYLEKEIQSLNDYIELEKIRYGGRLTIQVEIRGDYMNKLITPLLMIPFIENSFKHGASKMLKEPWIKLFIQTDENILHFSLINSKPAEENAVSKKGIGLNNVKKRLELLYPQDHLLTIESTPNTFTVNMQIPLQKMDVI
jgi:sensor histidine kinase YesM